MTGLTLKRNEILSGRFCEISENAIYIFMG